MTSATPPTSVAAVAMSLSRSDTIAERHQVPQAVADERHGENGGKQQQPVTMANRPGDGRARFHSRSRRGGGGPTPQTSTGSIQPTSAAIRSGSCLARQ